MEHTHSELIKALAYLSFLREQARMSQDNRAMECCDCLAFWIAKWAVTR